MTRVLVILGGLGREGITNSVLTYLEVIDKKDIELHLGVAGKAEPEALERAEAINIPIHMLPGRNQEPLKYFFALIKLVRANKFDIVHVHGNSATLGIDMLGAELGGARVRIAHSRNTSCTHPKMDKMMRPLFNATYTEGFACGEEAGKWLFGNKKFTVIPNGKNIRRFLYNPENRISLREKYHAQDKIVIGHAGVFNDQKNHNFLIDVFREICNESDKYVLWLMGEDGGKRAEVEKKIKLYGLEDKVLFLGFKTDVEKYLSAMDIMVFPSLYEGLPNVVIEWQIAGLPCFLSDSITRECCVMDNVEYLPLSDGAKKWAERIRKAELADRSQNQDLICKKMADAGFDININAKKLKELYLNLSVKG